MNCLMNQSPRWVDYSGLPDLLNREVHAFGWACLKRVMELDGAANPEPDVIQEPIERMSLALGIPADSVREALEALTEKGYIEAFLPETDLEPAFIKIVIPLPVPISPLEIPPEDGGLKGLSQPIRLRYFDPVEEEESGDDSKFQQILHLYFELCGLKLNSLVVDDLKEIEKHFEMDKIKDAFQKAKRNNARSLKPVFRILYGARKKAKPEETPTWESLEEPGEEKKDS